MKRTNLKLNSFLETKYKSKSSKCLSGHYHPSRLEAGTCNSLMADLQAGRILGYEVHKGFDLIVNDEKITRHYPDFLVTGLDHKRYVVESKGFETDSWLIKKNLFCALFPEIKYYVRK